MFVNKTPRFYKVAANYVKKLQENGASIKQLMYSKQHPNIMGLSALINEVFKHFEQIKFLITHAKLENIATKNPWLIYVLITELLWGKRRLPDIKSTIFLTILSHKQKLEKLLPIAEKNIPTTEKTVNTPKYVRVNTLKASVSDAIAAFMGEGYNYKKIKNKSDYETFLLEASSLQEYDFMSDIHFDELLLFHPSCKFFCHKAYQNGLIILQDKASCIPAYLLNPPPGSVVLDACAAPGTKTTLLASLMKDEGTLYAVDRNQNRFKELKLFVEKSGATCVQTVHKDLLNLNGSHFPNVQYILVDPSCSGSGMLHRIGQTSVEKERLKKLQGFQILLLKHCLRHFHDAKRIVYSTCSVHPEENEEVVKDVLSSTHNFKLMSAKELLKGPWVNFGSSKYGDIGKKCLYSRSEKDLTAGFFVAVFERISDGEVNPYYREDKKKVFTHTKENEKFRKAKQESKNKLSNVGELSNTRKSFQSMLRNRKRSTKKVKREIVIRENTDILKSHQVFDNNVGNDFKNINKRVSEIINDEGKNAEFGKQNSISIKKKRKRDIDDDREYKKTKKISKSFQEVQSSGLNIDEKEDKNEFVENINQYNNKLKTKKKKRKLIDKGSEETVEYPQNDVTEKYNIIEVPSNEQNISLNNEWTNGAKRKLISTNTITIDALKVSSEKEKLKNRLLKKTFTFLNHNASTDLEKSTTNNNSNLNTNGNEHEREPNKSMNHSLEDRLKIDRENLNNVKGTFEENNKGKKSHRKKNKNTMIPFRGIIENNIIIIKTKQEYDSNEDHEGNSIKNKIKIESKKGLSSDKLNGIIELKTNKMGGSANNYSISNMNGIKDSNSDTRIKNSKKKSNEKNCDTSLLDQIVAIVKN